MFKVSALGFSLLCMTCSAWAEGQGNSETDLDSPKVIETQWGTVSLDVRDKREPEPASRTSWLEAQIHCKNGVKATVREGVCDSALDHEIKGTTLEIKYFILDPEATAEEKEEVCNEDKALPFKIDLKEACRKKSDTKFERFKKKSR